MRHAHVALTAFLAVSCAIAVVNGCAATGTKFTTSGSGGGITSTTASTTGATGGAGGVAPTATSSSTGQGGGIIVFPDASDAPSDAVEEAITNPCGSKCGAPGSPDLCDPAHLGLDDNCNGLVDEDCPCAPGQVHWCFPGDPSYHNAPGCFDGTETCSELGMWGLCVGGVSAYPPDNCFATNPLLCHAIAASPYATVDLKTGTGNFSANAVVGSEHYTVVCPTGVNPCPSVAPPSLYTSLQSGEYEVTYTKTVAGDPNPETCTFPLFVGAPGLRVELSWEHFLNDEGVDLDLHMHQPVNTGPWGYDPAQPQDCNWANCKVDYFSPPQDPSSPHWFPDTNMVPMPVNWDLQPILQNNTCYNDPHDMGASWQAIGLGCHNPRLDIDDITCDYSITDPSDQEFCTPENINVDYPPPSQWFRVGVHYYSGHELTYDVHPEVKIFCNGALSADLGPHNFYVPESPVTFEPADGLNVGMGNRFWLVGDVAFTTDACGNTSCTVKPLYSDAVNQTPLLTLDTAVATGFAPPWPPPP
jgi:hypothetical protein